MSGIILSFSGIIRSFPASVLKNIVADRARFAEIYQAIQQRKRIAVNIGSALPDLQEFVNKRLIDMEKKEQKALVQGNYNN